MKKETKKDIISIALAYLGVFLIGIPAMLTWQGVYLPGTKFINGMVIIIGFSAFPILVSTKILIDKYGKR